MRIAIVTGASRGLGLALEQDGSFRAPTQKRCAAAIAGTSSATFI